MDYGSNRATSERLGRMSRARPGRTGCSLRRRSAGARLGQAASVLAMRQPQHRFRAHRYAEMSARMTFLTRIDPTRNIDRFYVVQVLPTLFGDWTVLREWGRRGSPGTMRT